MIPQRHGMGYKRGVKRNDCLGSRPYSQPYGPHRSRDVLDLFPGSRKQLGTCAAPDDTGPRHCLRGMYGCDARYTIELHLVMVWRCWGENARHILPNQDDYAESCVTLPTSDGRRAARSGCCSTTPAISLKLGKAVDTSDTISTDCTGVQSTVDSSDTVSDQKKKTLPGDTICRQLWSTSEAR